MQIVRVQLRLEIKALDALEKFGNQSICCSYKVAFEVVEVLDSADLRHTHAKRYRYR